jgi:hypothetical protein
MCRRRIPIFLGQRLRSDVICDLNMSWKSLEEAVLVRG